MDHTEAYELVPAWAQTLECGITVCDAECNILFINSKAREALSRGKDITGHNMLRCHNERSRMKIEEMLSKGTTNAYTIEKKGIRKLIYQTPWRKNGIIAGLVEISIVLPAEMPHHVRQ